MSVGRGSAQDIEDDQGNAGGLKASDARPIQARSRFAGRFVRVWRCITGPATVSVLLSPIAWAADEPKPDPHGDEEIRIREVFSSHLPGTMAVHTVRLSLHPHLGDLQSQDNIRLSAGLRYGVTPRWEAGVNTDFYFSHSLGNVPLLEEYGMANLQFSTKYNLGKVVLRDWETAVGFDATTPIGSPPTELTDGLRHFGPWVSFSRRLESRPNLRLFWGVGTDIIEATTLAGKIEKNQFRETNANVNVGFILDQKNLHYSFETWVVSSRGLGERNHDLVTLRPGVIWEIPTRGKVKGRSNWVVGGALRTTIGPDGTDFGGSVKFRINFDLKKFLGFKPADQPAPTPSAQ